MEMTFSVLAVAGGVEMVSENPISKCSTCPTRQTSEWSVLCDEKLNVVDKARHIRTYEPGSTVFHQGENCQGIYCIQSGLIGVRRLDEDGNSILLGLCNAGEIIGYRALLSNDEHRSTAEALMPSALCFIERSVVTRLLTENPQLSERFLHHCIEDFNKTEDSYVRSLTLNLKARLLHALMVFYQCGGYRDERNNHVVEIPIQRTELADMIGATPESISRIIRKIEAEGLAQFNGRRVGISDINAVFREIGHTH